MKELLKKLGLDEDVINKIIEGMKEQKIFTSSEENLDIRYKKLKDDFDGKEKELLEANKLIEDFKKSTKGNEDLQTKITTYEGQIETLKTELINEKIENAIKVGLLAEKSIDVDYMTFKLKEKGEIQLDDNGKIKGWEDKISSLKTQFPNMFEGKGSKKIDENKFNKGDEETKLTKENILKKPYSERLKIYRENPQEYNKLMNG